MTTYRYAAWFAKGIREYCKSGFESASKSFESLENVNLDGRSFLITGANSGIGQETALAIAKMGGTVHLVCRNKSRGTDACEKIMNESGNENVYLHIVDMSKPREVHQFTKQFVQYGWSLDVLINNAGCMINTREVGSEGVELNFATNTLGTYLLTTGLVKHLQDYESPQVITVTSGGMLLVKLDSSDLQSEKMSPFNGSLVYSQNKRQQVVMTDHWSKQFPNVQFTTMHPGWADTPAVKTSIPDFYERMKSRLRSPQQGADTLIWLCASEIVREEPSGGFYQDRSTVSKHLPLAWTKSSVKEEEEFLKKLEEIASNFRS